MTAFLIADVLRTHAVSACLYDIPRGLPPRRPVLVAAWHVAPDGRLACAWTAEDPAPDHPN